MSDPAGPRGPVYGEVPRYGYQHPDRYPDQHPPYPAAAQAPYPPPPPLPFPSFPPPGPAPEWEPRYASWPRRVAGFLVDAVPALVALVPFAVGYVLAVAPVLAGGAADLRSGGAGLWLGVGGLLLLLAVGWQVYNRWVVAGRTGQSVGRRVLRVRLLAEATGQPIGPLNAWARDMVHLLDAISVVGALWPLWDRRRRTFADKLMRTIVVAETAPERDHA